MNVSAWLAQCAVAPRNGLNPQLEVPADLVVAGRAALLTAVAKAPRDQRRCAMWALSRNVPPRELHEFWRTQLRTSHDAQVRWEALYALSEIADPTDLELVLRQYFECPSLRGPLASWLRNWNERRIVPTLAALLAQTEVDTTRRNALYSLTWRHFAPELPADPDPEHGPLGAKPDSTAAPYRRWWTNEGQQKFAAEQKQWELLAKTAHEVRGLEPDWITWSRMNEAAKKSNGR
jgi:hypothetical protein